MGGGLYWPSAPLLPVLERRATVQDRRTAPMLDSDLSRIGGWGPAQGDAGTRGLGGLRVELQAEAVGQPRQVVEDANDVRQLQQRLVIEAQLTQRLPVGARQARRRRAELLRHGAERPFTRG